LDNLTHTLFAVTLGRTSLGRAGRGTAAALVLASNAPDIDVVSALRGGTSSYMHWHRGPTHGALGVLGLGFASAGLVWLGRGWLDKRRHAEPTAPPKNASFGMLVAISMIAIALHILMDLPTSYGTRVLSPFDWHWYAFDWMPIVDIYLLIVLGAGLLFGLRSEAARRRNAAIALALMAANYGVRAVAHHQALQLAPRLFGPTLPARCANAPDTSGMLDEWPRSGADQAGYARADGRRCLVELAALPTFLSPFDWRIVAEMSNAYEIHEADVLDSRFRHAESAGDVFWRQSSRYPNIWTPPIARAAAAPAAQIFLGFSRFPAARVITDGRGVSTVRFSDIRFAAGLVALEQPVRRPAPFSLLVRLDASGRVIEQSLSP